MIRSERRRSMEEQVYALEEITTYYQAKLEEKEEKLNILMTMACESITEELSDGMQNLQEENNQLKNIIRSLEHELCSKNKIIMEQEQKCQQLEDIIEKLESDKIEVFQQMEAMKDDFAEKLWEQSNTVVELLDKMSCTEDEWKIQTEKMSKMEALINQFRSDLTQCTGFIQEPRKLQEGVKAMYQRHVQQIDIWRRDEPKVQSDHLNRERLAPPVLNRAPKPELNDLHMGHRAQGHKKMMDSTAMSMVLNTGHPKNIPMMNPDGRDALLYPGPRALNPVELDKFHEHQRVQLKEERPRRITPLRLPSLSKRY